MTPTLAILLLVNAAFAVVVWPTFYRRVARDARARDAAGKATRFLSVHRVIVGIAYLIAAASTGAAIVSFY
ncbi:SCO4848 family membrane protein [Frigoribacterium sp. CG_9.8]|uniref:SCO4848 family membrane protein n=1 Tax=Frigoribacterium sp. CG_9.8 TaxID=2787733 RepID=UPI0018CA384E|nr:ABC-type transport system involved in cytochrome bd biosynthesis fused ATPase/permease subunit [Frigoribacterium sp. CG_9.8]